jgi:hypothetical protein
MRLETDQNLRKALHGLYIALFKAKQDCPDYFSDGRLTKILTDIMGMENEGWRVVGITHEALDLLATKGFDKNKLPRKLCRGHIIDRVKTTRELFKGDEPKELNEFFDYYLDKDQTVIMLNEQNRAKIPPEYIKIDNPNAELFPNGSLMGWKHREEERKYLRNLHSSRSSSRNKQERQT